MKKAPLKFRNILLTVLLVAGVETAFAQSQQKRVDKDFNVTKSTRFSVDNKFGKVHINTWDQNKIEVRVLVKAEGSQEQAKDILDRITIDIDESPSEIRFETEIEDTKKWRNERFQIDYTIKMPKGNPLHINHRHGDIYLDNFSGPLELDLAHGQIVAESLTGKSVINLQHGNGGRITAISSGSLVIQHYQNLRVGSLGSMELEIAHSTLELEQGGDLDLGARHSNLKIASAGALDLSLQHGKIEAGNLRSLKSEMQHSSINIERLQQYLEAKCNHSEVKIGALSKGFSLVNFDGNHSFLGLRLESGTSANIEAEFNFGKLHFPEGEVKMSHINIEDQRSEYKGTVGNNPKGEIRVKGSFSDCKLSVN